MLDEELLHEFVVCPRCKGRLNMQDSNLVCDSCSLVFGVKNGIPVLLETAEDMN